MKMIGLIVVVLLMVTLWWAGYSDWHLNRNQHNLLPMGQLVQVVGTTYQDSNGRRWELQPASKNIFHQPDETPVSLPNLPYPNLAGAPIADAMNPNLKFLSPTGKGGSYEAIMQPNGDYLVEAPKMGTYNYGHPSGIWGSLKHVVLDVAPHFICGDYW
ncbi:hypothetical protein [Lewinella sp. LCG006]|uniref:hypothetical protein n=1 Tax=Lewinella sp. LCG006 TaxID=3231911 RepID=UPI0034602267